ncbi:MAG: hypothetical protein HN778_18910 [Prolixibacteraceae bacterium]|nr:hypothetical protein [Prolixibacteraceae bacterium]MBT6765493.1 hypothetical protein [Prolixibacteraceae bacterium]MBT6997038.1 hypothetical protein [Prolixibacteraceae bacterium]MBT7396907.1 hypothetical protein [Prolixibacteraceae bacterium]
MEAQVGTSQKIHTSQFNMVGLFYDPNDYYGILRECPVHSRSTNCPIKNKGQMSFKEKLNWFDGLSRTEKCSIVNHHIKCSNKRACNRKVEEFDFGFHF